MLWTSLAGAALAGAMAVLIIRYMRKPRVQDLEISALRFLPPLSPAQRDRVQWRISAPLASWLFWLRLACLGLLLAIVFADWHLVRTGQDAHLGLRIAIDRSPSMALGEPSRLQLALVLAQQLQQDALAKGGCAEVAWVPPISANAGDAGDAGLRLYEDGIPLAQMIAAFRQPDRQALQGRASCAFSHAVMISDLPRPDPQLLTSDEENAPQYLWRQVGGPEANTALRTAEFSMLAAGEGYGVLTITIDQYGSPATVPELEVTGPDGRSLSPLEPVDLSLRGTKRVDFPASKAGTYLAELREAGGLSLDNRLRIDLKTLASLKIGYANALNDPQLRAVLPRLGAPAAPEEKPDIAIAPYSRLADDMATSGIYLAAQAAEPQVLGYFDRNSPLLELVDLDLLEEMRPGGAVELPQDFRRIAAAAGSGQAAAWIAVRGGTAPAVLLPARPAATGNRDRDEQLAKAWWVLFLNAYRYVTESRLGDVTEAFVGPDDTPLANVASESNTSQLRGVDDTIDSIQPTIRAAPRNWLWWPWLACVATLLFLFERIVGLRRN